MHVLLLDYFIDYTKEMRPLKVRKLSNCFSHKLLEQNPYKSHFESVNPAGGTYFGR